MNDWLKNLKVGDKVIVSWITGCAVKTVEKITPAGNIKVGGIMFNSNGSERGGDAWSKSYLHEATPEVIEGIRNEAIIKKAIILMRKTSNITLEQAEKIIDLLANSTDKGGEKK